VAINSTARMGSGFSSITDVNAPNGGVSANFQESFLFAEVLKYSYLIQSDQDDEWHVNHNGVNEWVFNTEAHPMKVRGNTTPMMIFMIVMLINDIHRSRERPFNPSFGTKFQKYCFGAGASVLTKAAMKSASLTHGLPHDNVWQPAQHLDIAMTMGWYVLLPR
jgi:hypothetical protein